MKDDELSIARSLISGFNFRQRQQLIQSIRGIGSDPLPKVRLLIGELDSLVDTYEDRDWGPIEGNSAEQVKEFRENYLKLHKKIVGYFLRVNYGGFLLDDIEGYDSVQNRLVLEDRLTERRRQIQNMWDFYHEVTGLLDQLRSLPTFCLQRAPEYGKALVVKKTDGSGSIDEALMRDVLREGDGDQQYLHAKWFLAKLFIEQQPARIEAETGRIDDFERSFQKATAEERNMLSSFKRNQDEKYCTPNYNVTYAMWCAQLGGQVQQPEQIIRVIMEIKDAKSR